MPDACPSCTASLKRDGWLHCESPSCTWIKCKKCGSNIDSDTETYFNEQKHIWGTPEGYLKAG